MADPTRFTISRLSDPDSMGRQTFHLEWVHPDGEWIPQPSPVDGEPVGYRRGQVHHEVLSECVARLEARGCTVEVRHD